jgi:hypothetical protein
VFYFVLRLPYTGDEAKLTKPAKTAKTAALKLYASWPNGFYEWQANGAKTLD